MPTMTFQLLYCFFVIEHRRCRILHCNVISQTPLQFAALMSAIVNGGTLYCLQYPRNAQEAASFTSGVKRTLNIEAPILGIIPGLREAVDRGTARALARRSR
jgi:cell division protein FtsI/penicillin-binding protein 2